MLIYILLADEIGSSVDLQVFLTYEELKTAYKRTLDEYITRQYGSIEEYENATDLSYTEWFDEGYLYFQDDDFCIRTFSPSFSDDEILKIIRGPSTLLDNGLDIEEDDQDELL